MNNLNKMGAIAALVLAFAYIIGIVLFVTILSPVGPLDPVEEIAFLIEKQTIMYVTMLIIYVISGLALVVLVQALYERLKVNALVERSRSAAKGRSLNHKR